MASNLREELKARKQAYVQEEILATAARLFAESGIRAVTIDDIASSLGYTKSVVYYYFKNKNQVLWEIFNRIHEEWWQDMVAIAEQDLPPDQLLAAMVRKHALNVMDRTEWTAIYFRDQSELTDAQQAQVTERKRDFDKLFRQVYEQGVASGAFRNIPPYLIVSGIIGMCNATHAWFKKSGPLTPAAIADHYASLVLDGCRC
ncbi:TetR/AcrR family transcriptional regulator [Paracoccus pantotrophus]|uniref:TetR/AcrR family transcriptional regulator n=1 Tax=Paracoccus pantotrophus TaxID=82367 RepID=UPI000490600A|nr:TetR/AcrR family transcriptional regulator [Paracoccus pantotrophus]